MYIVNPINGQIRLTWNKSPHALRGTDKPRLLADVLLEELSVSVSERRYHSLLNLVDELQLKGRAVARWRPKTAVKEERVSGWGEGEVCGGCRGRRSVSVGVWGEGGGSELLCGHSLWLLLNTFPSGSLYV